MSVPGPGTAAGFVRLPGDVETVLARSASTEKLFNPLKQKLLRKRIPRGETIFGAAFLVLLALVAVWVLLQKNRYDPAERDLSMEALAQSSVEDNLYRRPLKPWVEPGTAGSTAPAPDLGVFPDGLLDGGWELDGRVESYDPSNVYEKINGAAEQYIAFGFRALHYVTLARDDRFLTVELYDQGSFPNALGIFAAQREAGRPVERRGRAFYYPTPAGAVGGIGGFYFKIAADGTGAEVTEKAEALVGLFSGLPVSQEAEPPGYSILADGLGLSLDRIAYERSDVFRYDFLSDFWFGTVGEGSAARYFVHQAADAEEAATLFGRLLEEQLFEYALLERDEESALLRHEYLETVFGLRRVGPLLVGVEGAESREHALDCLGRLEGVIEG
jgi:hypothetical protein